MVKRFLWRDRHGRTRVRKNGKTYPLRDDKGVWHEPDTTEGDRLYWEIVTGKRAEASRSWKAAIDLLRADDRWHELSPRYRADLEPILDYLVEKIGKRDVARLTAPDIYAAMDKNKHRVRFANYIPVAISLIFKVIVRKRWLTENPARGMELLKVPKDRRKPHEPWTDAAVAKWRENASPLPRLIFEIAVGSAQRPGDWVDFTWGDYDGDSLRLRQNKSDKPLLLPCTVSLKTALDTAKAALPYAPMPSLFIITEADGLPMTYRRMAQILLAERKRLGVEAHDQHALRYRAVKELAWAGCDDDEIMAYSGHSTKAMVRKYAGEARQEMAALRAREKRR
ncbi:integrase [Amaricoccus macauensis]|uniref:Integrase n=1 Tax=Amaricoccus macauensis TaxID=57001 RepID=A0A840SI27_9RHOB|nr:tyrosine-type recombinase/integrase [Amaricoccus macauensis]MBB5220594.1 integrase [Amaricoccus macauensis]